MQAQLFFPLSFGTLSPCMCRNASRPCTVGRSPYQTKSSKRALCKHSSFFRFPSALFRRACAGTLRAPALSGIRPIRRMRLKELCASTALFSASVWHGSLLTHIIAQYVCGANYFQKIFIQNFIFNFRLSA